MTGALSRYRTLRSYIGLARPQTLLAPIVGGIAFGWLGAYRYGIAPDPLILLLLALVMASLNAVSNLWNQVFDIDIDRVNAPYRPLPSGRASPTVTMHLGGGLAILAVGLTVHFQRPLVTYVVMVILVAAWAYSAPPWRLKRHMYLAPLAIATPRGGLGLLGAYLVYGQLDPYIGILCVLTAFFVYWGNITKDIPDVPGDALYGIRTLPSVYGGEIAKTTALVGMIGATCLYPLFGFWGVAPMVLHFLAWPLYKGPRGPWRFFYVQFSLNLLGILLSLRF